MNTTQIPRLRGLLHSIAKDKIVEGWKFGSHLSVLPSFHPIVDSRCDIVVSEYRLPRGSTTARNVSFRN